MKIQTKTFLPCAIGRLLAVFLLLACASSKAEQSVTFYHWDAAGSPAAASDEQGNLRWREDYKPYGEKIRHAPLSATNTRWFVGHPHDDAVGLTYMGARWYDPVIGRFMGVDPKSFDEEDQHSFNRFSYGNNNPYAFVDLDGRSSIFIGSKPVLPRPIVEVLPRVAGEAPVRAARPDFIRPEWGYNRVIKELHDRGYRLEGPTRNDKGLIYRNPSSGEAIRIMQKPGRQYRTDPKEKHQSDHYWRYQEGPGKEWGPPSSIPNKQGSVPLREVPLTTDPCAADPLCA